jgi:alpha-N-arabinofuranosidase
MKRRDFIVGAAATGGALVAGSRPAFAVSSLLSRIPTIAAAADSRIEILTGESIGTIAPEIYGHFVEHLGGVVYDGIWVGENSKISNIGGLRKS